METQVQSATVGTTHKLGLPLAADKVGVAHVCLGSHLQGSTTHCGGTVAGETVPASSPSLRLQSCKGKRPQDIEELNFDFTNLIEVNTPRLVTAVGPGPGYYFLYETPGITALRERGPVFRQSGDGV